MFRSQIAFPITANFVGDLGDHTHAVWKAPLSAK